MADIHCDGSDRLTAKQRERADQLIAEVTNPGMRKEFGLWWTPKEIADLREMGILGLEIEGWQVQTALFSFKQARENALMKGAVIGWTAGLLFMLLLRWLGS